MTQIKIKKINGANNSSLDLKVGWFDITHKMVSKKSRIYDSRLGMVIFKYVKKTIFNWNLIYSVIFGSVGEGVNYFNQIYQLNLNQWYGTKDNALPSASNECIGYFKILGSCKEVRNIFYFFSYLKFYCIYERNQKLRCSTANANYFSTSREMSDLEFYLLY